MTRTRVQIRHMVAAAVQAARQQIPVDFVRAALRRPSRAVFPLAPAQVRGVGSSRFSRHTSHQVAGVMPGLHHAMSTLKGSGYPKGHPLVCLFAAPCEGGV